MTDPLFAIERYSSLALSISYEVTLDCSIRWFTVSEVILAVSRVSINDSSYKILPWDSLIWINILS